MTSLAAARAAMQQAKRDNAEFFAPERAAWSDGVERQFKVVDPNRESSAGPLKLNLDPIPASLRLIKFHPDSPLPPAGASVTTSKGFVVLGVYTDRGNLFGTRVGVGRLIDERAYPQVGLIGTEGFRLRVEALDTPAVSADTGSLSAVANNSHRGFTPPGVQLQVGIIIITAEGDQYQVVPPVQRDILGDTLGLSWQGKNPLPAPLPPPSSSDPTPDTSAPAAPSTPTGYDPWWDERP